MSKLDANYLKSVAREIEAAQESERLLASALTEIRRKRRSIIAFAARQRAIGPMQRYFVRRIRADATAKACDKLAEWMEDLVLRIVESRGRKNQ